MQYQVKIDSKKTPKTIDFTHLIGENKDKTEQGIFVFDGEKLKLALDEKRKGPPDRVRGQGESETYSVIVQQTKQDKAENKDEKAEKTAKSEADDSK